MSLHALRKEKQNKQGLNSWAVLALSLLIVIGVSKLLLLAQSSLETNQVSAENLPPLPAAVSQNQISALVYDGYLK